MAWLHDLTDWLLEFAQSPWAVAILVLNAFGESIIWPVPPDPLLIGIAVTRPDDALWLAALVTVASVLGAFVGHWLGLKIGRPILDRLFPERYITRAEGIFQKYGMWAILVAAFTPIPFKVFTILAGVLRLDRKTLLIGSVIGRGARFMLQGALIMVYGEEIQTFIEGNLEIISWGIGGGIIAAIIAIVVYYKVSHNTQPAA